MSKPLASETSLDYIEQGKLDFDPKNPRFGRGLENLSQPDIQKALVQAPYYASELIDSLLKNGFIDYEPLVVRKHGNRYTVIEGNRRLAAIREILAYPGKYPGKTDDLGKIPALVFPDKPDDQQKSEMRVYLGVRHLLGIREWPPLSKAIFLERESKESGGLERVFKETQLKKRDARRFLIPYRLLRHAEVVLPPDVDYWMLGEALGRSGITKYLQLQVDSKTLDIQSYNKKNLGLLLNDLYGPKKDGSRDASKRLVDDTRDLSRLGKVLGSDKATAALRSGRTLEEAEFFVDSREESIKRLTKMTRELEVLLKKLLHGNRSEDSTRLRAAYQEFEKAVARFCEEKT